MRFHQAARDRQSEPRAAGCAIARRLEAIERLQHGLTPVRRNPRPLVIDGQNDDGIFQLQPQAGDATIFDGVVDDVGDDAPERQTVAEHNDTARGLICREFDVTALSPAIIGLRAHQRREVHHLLGELPGADAARQQRVVEQADHVVDVGNGALLFGRVGDFLDAQPQSRREGPDVMGDAADQGHARPHHLAQPRLQAVERGDDRANLRRAAACLGQRRRIGRQIDPVHGGGKLRQWPGFALHDQQGQQRHDGAEQSGAEADRQTERRHRQAGRCVHDQRFPGIQSDPELDRVRHRSRQPRKPSVVGRSRRRRNRDVTAGKRGGIHLVQPGLPISQDAWRESRSCAGGLDPDRELRR